MAALTENAAPARNKGAAASASWLAVRAGVHPLLIPLSHAGEVGVTDDIQKLPYARPWFLGVINVRGILSGVVDLAAFLGQAGVHRSDAALARCQLIRFSPQLRFNCALLVDEIIGMRAAHAFVGAKKRQADDASYFGDVYIDQDDLRWRELNLQALIVNPSFLDIRMSS